MTESAEPAILLSPPVVDPSVDLSRPIAMPDPKPTPLMCEVPTCRVTTSETDVAKMHAAGWTHDDEFGWQCPDHPSDRVSQLILELERIFRYTVRPDKGLVHSDPDGRWVMFADISEVIEKYRG